VKNFNYKFSNEIEMAAGCQFLEAWGDHGKFAQLHAFKKDGIYFADIEAGGEQKKPHTVQRFQKPTPPDFDYLKENFKLNGVELHRAYTVGDFQNMKPTTNDQP
jgi:hypothetical protein